MHIYICVCTNTNMNKSQKPKCYLDDTAEMFSK